MAPTGSLYGIPQVGLAVANAKADRAAEEPHRSSPSSEAIHPPSAQRKPASSSVQTHSEDSQERGNVRYWVACGRSGSKPRSISRPGSEVAQAPRTWLEPITVNWRR